MRQGSWRMVGFALLAACATPRELAPKPVDAPKAAPKTAPAPPRQAMTKPEPTVSAPAPAPEPAPETPALMQAGAAGFRFWVSNFKLYASDGRRSVALPIPMPVTSIARVTLRGAALTLAYRFDGDCSESVHETTFTHAELSAKLINAEALKAHRAQRYEEAAGKLMLALAHDPSFTLARTNLACALALLGKKQEAIEALAPLIADNPVLAYSKLYSDPELASLRDAPEIAALRAKRPGTAPPLTPEIGAMPWVGLDGRAVAVFLREDSWGAMNFWTDLVIYDVQARRELLRIDLVNEIDHETGKVAPAKRAQLAQRLASTDVWLRDLGFAPEPGAKLIPATHLTEIDRDHVQAGRTPLGNGLQLLLDGREARVKRGGVLLGRAPTASGWRTAHAVHLPSAGAVVLLREHDDPEGCYVGDFVFADVIPLERTASQ